MENEIYTRIDGLKQQAKFDEAWHLGFQYYTANNKVDWRLRGKLFWICYGAIKATQTKVLNRENKAPNNYEQNTVNTWIYRIDDLNLPQPEKFLDFKFFNLFKGCGEHYKAYIEMLIYYDFFLFTQDDFKPFVTDRGEAPSLVMRLARQIASAWLQHVNNWNLNFDKVLRYLKNALLKVQDHDKIWLHYDIANCLNSMHQYNAARVEILKVLRRKKSEAWAWGALAETFVSENYEAAIICNCRAVTIAQEAHFAVPYYFSLAKLLAKDNTYNLASALLVRLVEIYKDKGWKLRPEHEEVLQQSWFDASSIENINLEHEVKERARNALQYVTEKLEIIQGIVDKHHRSGKGFDIYIDLDKKFKVAKNIFLGKGLPQVGTWLELKIGRDGDEIDVFEAKAIKDQMRKNIVTVEGSLKLNPKGFGFVDDAFIPPFLLENYQDGDSIKVIKIWDRDPKKNVASWRVIKVNHCDSHDQPA